MSSGVLRAPSIWPHRYSSVCGSLILPWAAWRPTDSSSSAQKHKLFVANFSNHFVRRREHDNYQTICSIMEEPYGFSQSLNFYRSLEPTPIPVLAMFSLSLFSIQVLYPTCSASLKFHPDYGQFPPRNVGDKSCVEEHHVRATLFRFSGNAI